MTQFSQLRRCALATACLSLLHAQVQAQSDPGQAQASSDTLPEIIVIEKAQEVGYEPKRATTATRSEQAILDVPQSIGVVPALVIEDQAARNIDEALYNISGMQQTNTLGGTQDAIVKRGFGFNRDGSILRDGVRTVLARNFSYAVERVEVLKGPSSMLYGVIDPGGLINMVTKKPQLHFAGQAGVNVNAHGGGLFADVTGPIGKNGLAYRLLAEANRSDYWRNFGKNKHTSFAPSIAWYGGATTLRASYEHIEYEQPFDRGTFVLDSTNRVIDTPRKRRFDEDYNRTIGDSDFFTLQGQHIFSDAWKGNLTYSYNQNRYDDYQARPISYDEGTGLLTRRADGTRGAKSSQHVLQASVLGKLKLGGTEHEIIAGFDAERWTIKRRDLIRGSSGTFDVWNPVYGRMPHGTAIATANSDQSDKLRGEALFVQDSVRLSPHWIVQAGLRWQRFTEVAGRGIPFVTNTDTKGSKFVPRVGVVWQPDKRSSYYLSYSHSFKPNMSFSTRIGDLPPEQGRAWELGAKYDLPSGLLITAAIYNIEKRNTQASETINGESFVRATGKVRSRGFELDAAGRLGKRWQLIGAYALTDTKVLDDAEYVGNTLQNVAKHTLSLSLAHDFDATAAGGRWRAGAGVRHVSSRPGDAANSFFLPGYTLADAFVSYTTQIGQLPLRLQLNVKNLLDKSYYPSAGGRYYIAVGEPRSVNLRAQIDF